MSVNVELLKKTLAHIEAHPEEWNQLEWCGTSCCFAGHAALLSGSSRVIDTEGAPVVLWARVRRPDGKLAHVWDVAEQELGLDEARAERLFQADNTIEDLRRIVSDLIADAR